MSTTGKWSKVDCGRSQSRVVCKAPLGMGTPILADVKRFSDYIQDFLFFFLLGDAFFK